MHKATIIGIVVGLGAGIALGIGLVGRAEAQNRKGAPVTTSGQQVSAGSAQSTGSTTGSGSQAVTGTTGGTVRDPSKNLFVVTYDSTRAAPASSLMAHERYMAQSAVQGIVLLDGMTEHGAEMAVVQFQDKEQASAWLAADPNVKDGTINKVELQAYSVIHERFGGKGVVSVPRPGTPPRGDGG